MTDQMMLDVIENYNDGGFVRDLASFFDGCVAHGSFLSSVDFVWSQLDSNWISTQNYRDWNVLIEPFSKVVPRSSSLRLALKSSRVTSCLSYLGHSYEGVVFVTFESRRWKIYRKSCVSCLTVVNLGERNSTAAPTSLAHISARAGPFEYAARMMPWQRCYRGILPRCGLFRLIDCMVLMCSTYDLLTWMNGSACQAQALKLRSGHLQHVLRRLSWSCG